MKKIIIIIFILISVVFMYNVYNQEKKAYEVITYDNLTELTYSKYDDLLKTNEKFVLMLTQNTCDYCQLYLPILDEIAVEENIDIYVIDLLKMNKEELKQFIDSLYYFKENKIATPLTLVIENKEVKDKLEAFNSKERTIDFYKKNNVIKEK